MSEFEEILSAFAVDILHAQENVDQASVDLAEQNSEDPLRHNLSKPRFRITEVNMDFPMVIEGCQSGNPSIPANKDSIILSLNDIFLSITRSHSIEMPDIIIATFQRRLSRELSQLEKRNISLKQPARIESVVRAVAVALQEGFDSAPEHGLTMSQIRQIQDELFNEAKVQAIKQYGIKPKVYVSTKTSEVVERGNSNNITRVSFKVKQEGVEWALSEGPEGTQHRTLTVE